MTQLDRRQFFSATMAAVGFSLTPTWCAEWFRPQDPNRAREDQLRAAVARAREQGKPLLVFVVPGDGTADTEAQKEAAARGHWFGAFLSHGGSRALLEVALCVPACARLDEVRRSTRAEPIEGAPVLLVIDVAAVGAEGAPPPKVTPLPLELGSPFGSGWRGATEGEDAEAERRRIEATIERMTVGLHQTVHRHGGSMAALATDVTARLTPEQAERLSGWLAGGAVPSDELLVRCAAEVRRQLGDEPDARRAALQGQLVDAVERAIVRQPLPGGRWYTSGGCGPEPEDPTPAEKQQGQMVACGMGMVPIHCDRFLGLWTEG